VNELLGAHLRLGRAREHLPNLEEVVKGIETTYQSGVVSQLNPDTGGWEPIGNPVEFLELRASVVVGEIVHNLRASLDYLVYALARADSGRTQHGTQFPIADTAQLFTARRNTFLKGVSEENVAVIRKYQPYSGCDWTRTLRELSNTDKHRDLVGVKANLSVLHAANAVVPWNTETNTPLHPFDSAQAVQMYLHGSAFVHLPEGLGEGVVDTLAGLALQVERLLSVFEYQLPPALR